MKNSGSNGKEQGKVVSRKTEAHRALETLPEARVKKVARIQAAMDDGDYQVEGQQVAEKMVTNAVRELRNRSR